MATTIQKADVYWHVYGAQHIRQRNRGHLIYVLEIPTVKGPPVMRSIFDLSGQFYPSNINDRLHALFADHKDHGLVFAGVSQTAVQFLLSIDPVITAEDPLFFNYNWGVIQNSLNFLLARRYSHPLQILEPFAASRHAGLLAES